MTPAAPTGARAPAPKTDSASPGRERTAPGRRRNPPRGPVPRRVSGPAAPARRPRPAPAERQVAAPARVRRQPPRARNQTLSARLAAFLRSLPDHPLLDRAVRGRAWIPLLGVMLVGIVAMQVELLKLNADTGRSIELISALQSRNDVLRAQVTSASDPSRIERLAAHMGMTMPGPEAITFLKAGSSSVRRAVAAIRVPDLAAFEAALRVSNAEAVPPAAPASTGATTSPSATGSQTTTTATTAPPATGPQTTTATTPAATAP